MLDGYYHNAVHESSHLLCLQEKEKHTKTCLQSENTHMHTKSYIYAHRSDKP